MGTNTETPLNSIRLNPDNPRTITADAFKKLCDSIQRDGDAFMTLRPIVYNVDGLILGGNQRYTACVHLGIDPLPAGWAICANSLTIEQQRRFILVDNAPDGMAGAWDWEILGNEWSGESLLDMGFTIPVVETEGGISDTSAQLGDTVYRIMITCATEENQVELLDRFEREGIQCQALIS